MNKLLNTKGKSLAFAALSSLFLTLNVQPVFAETPSLTTLMEQIVALQSRVDTLESDLTAVKSNSVLGLDGLLSLDYSSGNATAVFDSVNVQITNGDRTYSSNGLGNLILGYNRAGITVGRVSVCSDGQFQNETDCIGAGEIWAKDHKTGSHYLIIGDFNNYSQAAGIVAGENNTSNSLGSMVLGGGGIAQANIASGFGAVIVGGGNNRASDRGTVIVGGANNRASGVSASIIGGF